jgi:predicted HicB family RNase H-like nuclease
MAVSERKKASNKKWDVANIERLSIAVPKGQRDEIKTAAAAAGESVNAYIIAAIRARMGNADGGAAPAAEIVQAAQPVAEAQPGQVLDGAALESAKVAAAAAGETLPAFVARAVRQAADADARERLLAVACKNASLPSSADASAAAESCEVPAYDVVDWAARTDHLRALREAARASAGIPSPEQTAPGNSGDLPPEQAGPKTPGD